MIECKRILRFGIAGVVLLFAAGMAKAQGSRAARLTFTEGTVHIGHAGAASGNANEAAQVNMPLIEGQVVATGDNGQAEVEFEDGSLARLTPNSTLSLAHLSGSGGDYRTQLVLDKGLAYFELRAASQFVYMVSAGADRITPVENATFRVALDEPPATIAVLDGTAHIERSGAYATDVQRGETFRSDLVGSNRYFLTEEIASDSWDQWNEARDQMAADAASQNTAARDNFAGNQGYGWSDLDANGRWYDVAGQGQVWQPTGGDAPGFDPYGNGSWVWYQNTGYVWASGYAWGWTPFRCGGWSYWDSFGWGWTPNASCGGYGFAGGGYGYGGYGNRGGNRGPLNIILPPLHYTGHRPPAPGRGGDHPIIGVHENPPGIRRVPPPTGIRTIGGIVAKPLAPNGPSYTARGGSAVGSSLRRDYPVDRASRTPILGIQPGQGPARPAFVSGAIQNPQQPRVGANGAVNGYNGVVKGSSSNTPGDVYSYGHTNGYTNGAPSGFTNGAPSGYTNGAASGFTNGPGSSLPPPGLRTLPPPDMRTGGYQSPRAEPHNNVQIAPRNPQMAMPQGGSRMASPQVNQAPAQRMSPPPQMAPQRMAPPPAASPRGGVSNK